MEKEKTFLDMPGLERSTILDIIDNTSNNELIIYYYNTLADEKKSYTLKNKAENIENCSKFWNVDHYKLQKIKNVKNLNTCKDKFCFNCKKILQASRLAKYMPVIEKYKDKMYHMVLTVPNCTGHELRDVIKNMSKSFRYLYRLLRGDFKIKGINLDNLNLIGAVRSLEVTNSDGMYHPHFHVLIHFNVNDEKNIVNKYSYNYGKMKTKFSEFEILIQKIWRCIYDGVKLTKSNIDESEGYSIKIDKANENNMFEVFKYLTKITGYENGILTYDNFKDLYYALYRVKQIQGYGILYNVTDSNDVMEEMIALYKEYIDILNEIEMPTKIINKPIELANDNENKIITFKLFVKYYNELR